MIAVVHMELKSVPCPRRHPMYVHIYNLQTCVKQNVLNNISPFLTFVPTKIFSHTSSDNEIFTAVVLAPELSFFPLINISAK
jgi:hypothetical protein